MGKKGKKKGDGGGQPGEKQPKQQQKAAAGPSQPREQQQAAAGPSQQQTKQSKKQEESQPREQQQAAAGPSQQQPKQSKKQKKQEESAVAGSIQDPQRGQQSQPEAQQLSQIQSGIQQITLGSDQQGRQKQQKQPQKEWGPGGDQQQKQWGPGGDQQQKQWGPGGDQQQKKSGKQQHQPQTKQWGAEPQQQKQPPQQQQWGAGPQQQKQPPQQQQWGAGPQQQKQPPQQQQWGAGPQQQKQPPQQQQWGAGPQQQKQPPQQQGPQQQKPPPQQQQWGAGPQQQKQPPQQQLRQQHGQESRSPSQQSSRGSQQDPGSRPPSQQSSRDARFQKPSKDQSSKKKLTGVLADYCVRSSPLKTLQKWEGKVGEKHAIEANYMRLNLQKIPKNAYQYRVDFSLERPTRFRPVAFEQFRRLILSGNRTPGFPIAFDGRNIAFAAVKVADNKLNVAHTVKFVDVETNVEKEIAITMKEADDPVVELTALFNYHETGVTDQPLRALQCIDVVLRSAPAARAKVSGRAFYVQPPPGQAVDLGDLFVLWRGLHQSVVLGDYPMINIDIAHRAFLDNCNLMDAYSRLGHDASRFFRNLNIIYDPPAVMNGTRKLYKVNDLVESASRKRFRDQEGKEWTVEEYYRSKNVQLKRPDLPCVSVGTVRQACLPLEFCSIEPGQDVRRKAGANQTRALIKCAATSTTVRKQNIMRIFSGFEYNNNEIIRGFGLSLIPEFIKIIARNIPPPILKYSDGTARPQRGSWRANKFLQSAPVHKWGVFVTASRVPDGDIRELIDAIKNEARRCNMNIDNSNELVVETNPREFLSKLEKFKKAGCSIVFVVIPPFGDSYAKIKQAAEIKMKMLTQCIKSTTLRRIQGTTISNIFLKVNSKLNGVNHQLQSAPILQPLMTAVPVMFLGADVTHPSPDQSNIPSIVGVVASHDQLAFQYNVCYRLQDPREEMICDMESIVLEQLHFFNRQRNTFPQHIIYYRDGVSNGQFPQLQQIELSAIDRACAKVNIKYKPKITCLVVQKRHHTRFFPPVPSKIVHPNDRNQNVLPGTVVDTVITHPGEKQFFLVSHESIQGTAKPAKYCIIRDDADFQADQLQAITFALCHMFTRCNRSVSYPAPAYYAHLMAARGRAYIEGAHVNCGQLQREYDMRKIDEIRQRHPMFFV